MSTNGKGDKRRPGKPGAYERGYEAIDWSKGRKPAAPRKADVGRVLLEDYATPVQWDIPPLSEILSPNHRLVRIARCTEPGAWWESHIGETISVFATDSYGHWTRDTGPMRLSQWVKVSDTEEVET